jgi:hypothetical protein
VRGDRPQGQHYFGAHRRAAAVWRPHDRKITDVLLAEANNESSACGLVALQILIKTGSAVWASVKAGAFFFAKTRLPDEER